MGCWNNTAKIAIGSSIVGAATIAMIVIIFTAASWTTPVLWIELIGIGIIGLIGLLWIIIIAVVCWKSSLINLNKFILFLKLKRSASKYEHFNKRFTSQYIHILLLKQQRSAIRRRRNQAAVPMEAQPNPVQPNFRPTRAPQLPTTGYSPKLRDEKIKKEIDMKELTPPASPPEQAGSDARVPTNTSEEESTVSEAADKPYYNKHVEA
jgi:hypothetical protein